MAIPAAIAQPLQRFALQTFLVGSALGLTMCQSAFGELLLHYPFDEPSAGNGIAVDTGAAPQTNASFMGLASLVGNTPGQASAKALDLSSAGSNYLTTATDTNKVDALNKMTVTLWLNLRAAPQYGDALIGNDVSSAPGPGDVGGWRLVIQGDATDNPPTAFPANNFPIAFGVVNPGGGIFKLSRGFNADNRWIFVAATFDRDDLGRVSLFRGTETTAVIQVGLSAELNTPIADNNTPFIIGRRTVNSSADFTPPAWIDDVRVYNEVLSLAQLENVRLANVPEPSYFISLFFAAYSIPRFHKPKRREPHERNPSF